MKKTFLLKTMLLLCALVVGGDAWATDATITLTASNIASGSYSNNENTFTEGSVSFGYIRFIKNNKNTPTGWGADQIMQNNKSGTVNTALYNKTAIPGKIKKIRIYYASEFTNYTLSYGTASNNLTALTTLSSSSGTESITYTDNNSNSTSSNLPYYEYNLSSYNATFFKYSATAANYIYKIVLTYEPWTVIALSNNNTWGTVSLSGNVITATPAEGYRFSTTTPYTVTAGTATVVQNNNKFTVTPTTNCTVTINFEEIPTYTLSTVVSPTNAGNITLGTGTLIEGATTTATAFANAGYKFTGWSISGTGASLSSTSTNPTTVTMGTANATITANFEAVATHAITYSVNGYTNTVNVEENKAVDLSAPAGGIPTGYAFQGWATSEISGTQSTKPSFVTSATSTTDITYYAVMAVESTNTDTETLTQSEITTNLTNTTCAYGTAKSYTDGDITWTICAYTDAASRPWMQLKKDQTSYIKISAPGKINELSFTITSASNSSGGITDITKHTDYSGSIYLGSSAASNPTGALGSTNTISNDVMTITPTGNNNELYMQVSTGARVWGIDVNYNVVSYSRYCTTVPDETVTITAAGLATYASDFDLDYTSVSGIEAYIATGTTSISLTKVNKVPAGTGVLLRATAGGTSFNVPVTTAATDNVTGNLFVRGTGAAVASSANGKYNYILNIVNNQIGFYRANNQTVATNRAYLHTTINAPSDESRIELTFDGQTGIATVNRETTTNNRYFDLQGRPVAQPTKGLYIVNGKKVLVK